MSYNMVLLSGANDLVSVYARLNDGLKLVNDLLSKYSFNVVNVKTSEINGKNPILISTVYSVKNGKEFNISIKCAPNGVLSEVFDQFKLESKLSNF